jgi:molecular chaperone Hsp33
MSVVSSKARSYLPPMSDNPLTIDVALGVAVPSRNARGRLIRLGPTVESILSAHNYPPAIERLLAEALVLTGLMGSLLKEAEGQVTIQAQTENGIVDLLVCDYLHGELRGYVRHDPGRLADAGPNPSLAALFGKGYLAITFDHPQMEERYQGIVPLEGESLALAAQSFFAQSEQIPSIVRLAAIHPPSRPRARKGASGSIRGSTIPTGRTSPSSRVR